jgi:hypothetical protein
MGRAVVHPGGIGIPQHPKVQPISASRHGFDCRLNAASFTTSALSPFRPVTQ